MIEADRMRGGFDPREVEAERQVIGEERAASWNHRRPARPDP